MRNTQTMATAFELLVTLTLVIISQSLTLIEAKSIFCPTTNCSCLDDGTVDCRRKYLSEIPHLSQPPNNETIIYRSLVLQENLIQHIGPGAFGGVQFAEIDLMSNPIVTVDRDAFTEIRENLLTLKIGLNKSAEFPSEALRSLSALRKLVIKDYGKPELPSGALAGLTTLEEINLSGGALETLNAEDLQVQHDSLKILILYDNKLRVFPTEALKCLKILERLDVRQNDNFDKALNLSSNGIPNKSLVYLDLSYTNLVIDNSAFDIVAQTLHSLTIIRNTHLRDSSVFAKLVGLRDLDVSWNSEVTNWSPMLDKLKSLERLNCTNNIFKNGLTRTMLGGVAKLKILNLANCNFEGAGFQPDVLKDLRYIRNIILEKAVGIHLDESSFRGLTLESINLNSINLSKFQWNIFSQVPQLQSLYVTDCQLGDIPPWTFAWSIPGLRELVTAGNRMTGLNRSSFAGASLDQLKTLTVRRNQLFRIDPCLVRDLKSSGSFLIDILDLSENPLDCGCSFQELFEWLGPIKLSYKNWNCDNGLPVSSLTSANFSTCSSSSAGAGLSCPKLTGLEYVRVNGASKTSLGVSWLPDQSVIAATKIDHYRVVYSEGLESNLTVILQSENLTILNLRSNTRYTICVSLANLSLPAECVTSKTAVDIDLIAASAAVGGAILLAVVIIIACAVSASRRAKKKRQRLLKEAEPAMGVHTKRFHRPTSGDASSTLPNAATQQATLGLHNAAANRLYSRSVDALQALDGEEGGALILSILRDRLQLSASLSNLDGRDRYQRYPSDQAKCCSEVYDEIDENLITPDNRNIELE